MQSFTGIVQKGARRGASLGFPTINIPLTDDSLSGIYAARVSIKDGEAPYMAAAYVDKKRGLLEAHLLDFSNDLYGMEVQIALHEKIRADERFADDAALRIAISEDIAKVREYFTT